MSDNGIAVGCSRDKRIDFYWKLEPLRRVLNKHFAYKCYRDENRNYLLSVLWSFICGYSVIDSFYYEPRTPKLLKRFLWRMKNYVYF